MTMTTGALGYQVKVETVRGCGEDLQVRALIDTQQFHDPTNSAEAAGVPPSSWSLFGVLWPSSRVLAHRMATWPLTGQRILEVGCGLALASLVLHRRGADITASDCHPTAEDFLAENCLLNGLPPLPYRASNWGRPNPELGRFGLIIGSDILYEPGQTDALAAFMVEHAEAKAQVIVVDPNRSHRSRFSQAMEKNGFSMTSERITVAPGLDQPYLGRLLTWSRG